ncbi:hypothetical protein Vafri_8071 [Volvox africanus]|uniref:Tubulin epsilon and delta complex protein 1 domain-containing protein n=1 Tax=Volvox africanus TaxID=51714 RepID=A0A8J4B262_9CHLO|nr:hypothetical protein Vafri_8071 [Volvox africanus]
MLQQALPAPNTARLAITSFCTLLRHHGITLLEPEIVRQAKFDGPVTGALWRVLHDVLVIVLAGCPSGPACQAALSRQWSQVSLELSSNDVDEFPREGAVLVLHQLATWGAPAGLLRRLGPIPDPDLISNRDLDRDPIRATCSSDGSSWPRSCRSRPLLLALSWLVAVAGLFERRIRDLEPGPELRALLPPYPQDACVSPAIQVAYEGAAIEAHEHVQKLPVGTASPAGKSGGSGARGGGGGGAESHASAEALWGDVETAAQRAVMLCGRVRSRLVALQAATDCRIRLSHSLWSQQAATAPASRPLTPYELQLCGQPSKMQVHLAALETATLGLLEQQELAAHGALFYEWVGSVLEEELQHQEQRQRQRQRHRGGGGGGDAATAGKESSRTGGGEALSSLEHLPYIDSDAGVRLAAHLEAQLQVVVQAANPELSAVQRRRDAAFGGIRQDGSSGVGDSTGTASSSGGGGGGRRELQQRQSLSSVTVEHFLTLAERAVPQNLLPGEDAVRHGAGGSESASGGGGGGGDGLSGLPLLVGSGGGANDTDAGPWRLPDDLTAALAAVQVAEHQQRCTAEEEEVQFQELRYAALTRYDFGGDGGAAPPAALHGPAAIGPAGPPAVAAASETQRLLGVVLAAARPLARIRAAHKASLMAALHDMPEGYFVSGV